jgi:hypothetical protein
VTGVGIELAIPFLFTMVRARIKGIAGLAIVLALVACGGGAEDQQPTPSLAGTGSLEYDRSSEALIIEVDTYGGLLPSPLSRHVPELRIYGDGLVVLAGEEGMLARGTDRVVMTGHLSEEELGQLLSFMVEHGFFQLEDRYLPSPAPTDLPARHVTVNLLDSSKTVTVYPFDFADAPTAFRDVYNELVAVSPADAAVFTPTSGTMTALDLGSIDDLPAGQRNQVAPWDTPLVGIALHEATEGAYLEGEQYRVIEEYLLRYPVHQLFGSQEGRVYQVRLDADLPWEGTAP